MTKTTQEEWDKWYNGIPDNIRDHRRLIRDAKRLAEIERQVKDLADYYDSLGEDLIWIHGKEAAKELRTIIDGPEVFLPDKYL